MPRDIRCWGPRNRPVEHTELMTTEEAAAVLGVVRNTVQGLVARGVLPAYQADPCKRGCPLKLPAFYVYRLAERPAYRARRAAFARSAPAGRAQTSGWADKDIQSVPKSGPTRSCDRDYGEFYTTRQAAVVLGVSPRTVYGLHRKGRLEGGSRTPELDAYLNALGAPRRSAGNRWLFFRKQDVHRLKNDPSYQKRRAADALGRDPEHVAAREAEQLARWFDARARARRSPPLFAPWPKLI
jgi:hypothetical protein